MLERDLHRRPPQIGDIFLWAHTTHRHHHHPSTQKKTLSFFFAYTTPPFFVMVFKSSYYCHYIVCVAFFSSKCSLYYTRESWHWNIDSVGILCTFSIHFDSAQKLALHLKSNERNWLCIATFRLAGGIHFIRVSAVQQWDTDFILPVKIMCTLFR